MENAMKTKLALFPFLCMLAVGSFQLSAKADGPVLPGDIKWGDGPPNAPHGTKLAVLAGDPSKPGLFVIRFKFPANSKIPAHSHPTDEYISVVSGAFLVGVGDKLDPKKTTALPPGGFITAPAKVNHYAITKKETVVQITGTGPFEMTYVNPTDDPSATAK
jgi:quercetin dioxygenase-like cupin family protein